MPRRKVGASAVGVGLIRGFDSHLHHKLLKAVKKMKRQKYGLRKDGLKDVFSKIKPGDILSIPLSDAKIPSLRTRAGELNSVAGYTKYSVSVDNVTETVRVINNG